MPIDLDIDGGIATILIDRPAKLNAMDHAHYRQLSRAWVEVRDNPEIRVAIVTGAGDKAFSVGADLKSFTTARGELGETWMPQRDMLLNRGLEVFKPVIAAVNGYCLGGGMTLLMATDIRIASETATFGLTEVKRGLIAANGGTQRVLKQLPHAIAMELLLTGRSFDAQEALRWGLVNRVVPPAGLMGEARGLAAAIAENAPLAIQASKELALRSHDMDLAAGLRAEQLTNRLLQTSDDVAEGARAFAEKRAPHFRGI